MRMPDAGRQHAAKTIQIFVSLFVPHVHAFAAFERERLLVIHRDGGKQEIFVFLYGIRNR